MRDLGAAAALTSGILAALATVSPALFGIVEASTATGSGATRPSAFVRLSDGLSGFGVLVAVPAAYRLDASWRIRATGVSLAALAIGVASLMGYAGVVLSFAAGVDQPTLQGPLTVAGLGGIGLWILLVSAGRADAAVNGNLRTLGIAVGLGNLSPFLAYFVGGGSTAVGGPLAPGSAVLLVAYAAGVISSDLGYPIWAFWVGRRWRAGRG